MELIVKISKRQKEVLELLCQGKSDDYISQTLEISRSTVREEVIMLRIEYGARNRVELAYKAGKRECSNNDDSISEIEL